MTKHEPTIEPKAVASPAHKSIAAALAAAQAQMGKALKSASNPHFKSKYADLASVVDACMPALNSNGIAVIQPTTDDENGRFVETILIHGETGGELKCRVPLIVGKNDMQGYGSAVTYARRYGLMSMAGIAPEDDDGNAAVKNGPVKEARRTVTPQQFITLRDKAEEAGVDDARICSAFKAPSLEQFPAEHFAAALAKLEKTIAQNTPKDDDMNGDHIPEPETV
jgi:hypothetical protein